MKTTKPKRGKTVETETEISAVTTIEVSELEQQSAQIAAKPVPKPKRKRKIRKMHVQLVLIMCSILMAMVLFLLAASYFGLDTGTLDAADLSSLSFVVIMFVVSLALTIAISFFASRNFIRPIEQLGVAINRVSQGDFSVKVNDKRKDEFGLVAKQFNSMVTELSSIETLRNDFIGYMSHQFKTPLAAIQGYVTLLEDSDKVSEAERKEYLNVIKQSSAQLSKLVSDLLMMSRMENTEMLVGRTRYSLDEQLREVLLLLEKKWSAKNIDLTLNLPELEITAAKDLLAQVWLNIIDNAVKFSAQNGTIEITLEQQGDQAVVLVRDNGCGMSSEVLSHALDKFYHSESSSGADKGNGIGLYLVKRIVDLSGGRIVLSSSENQGTSFGVYLPLNVNADFEDEAAPRAAVRQNEPKPKSDDKQKKATASDGESANNAANM